MELFLITDLIYLTDQYLRSLFLVLSFLLINMFLEIWPFHTDFQI